MARGGGILWYFNPIPTRLAAAPNRLDTAIQAVMQREATEGQNWMRSNASWQDQTGNARQGLMGTAGGGGGEHYIVLSHSVDYGIWLEVRWSGRYEIIKPALDRTGREVMQTLNGLMAAM